MVTVLVHRFIVILGPSLIGSAVDSLHQWSSSVLMLSAVNQCLQFVLVRRGIFHFIILNLRLRCRSTRCNNSKRTGGRITVNGMVLFCRRHHEIILVVIPPSTDHRQCPIKAVTVSTEAVIRWSSPPPVIPLRPPVLNSPLPSPPLPPLFLTLP